jgi:hypothetical protein
LPALQSEAADYYQFQVSVEGEFFVSLIDTGSGHGLPPGTWLSITDTSTNQPVDLASQGALTGPASQVSANGQLAVHAYFQPGTPYAVRVARWASGAHYQFRLNVTSQVPDTPPPLTVGAAPAIRVRLLADSSPPPLPPLGPVAAGPSAGPSGATTGDAGAKGAGAERTGKAGADGITSALGLTTALLPAGTGSGTGGALPSTVAAPPSVYLALATGPVGAVDSPAVASPGAGLDPYDRIIGQGPALAYADRLFGMAVLTQVTPGSNGDSGESATPGATRAAFQQWWQAVQGLLAPGSRRQPAHVAPPASSPKFEATPEEETGQVPDQAEAPAGPDEGAKDPSNDLTGVVARRTYRDGGDVPGSIAAALAVSAVFADWAGQPPRDGRRWLGQGSADAWPTAFREA